MGYPGELTEEGWNAILDEMIWAMEYIIGDQWDADKTQWETNEVRCNAGCELMGKYFRGLWS